MKGQLLPRKAKPVPIVAVFALFVWMGWFSPLTGSVLAHGGGDHRGGGCGDRRGCAQSCPDQDHHGANKGAHEQGCDKPSGVTNGDGNNGCGNDADREDDNNGNCRHGNRHGEEGKNGQGGKSEKKSEHKASHAQNNDNKGTKSEKKPCAVHGRRNDDEGDVKAVHEDHNNKNKNKNKKSKGEHVRKDHKKEHVNGATTAGTAHDTAAVGGTNASNTAGGGNVGGSTAGTAHNTGAVGGTNASNTAGGGNVGGSTAGTAHNTAAAGGTAGSATAGAPAAGGGNAGGGSGAVGGGSGAVGGSSGSTPGGSNVLGIQVTRKPGTTAVLGTQVTRGNGAVGAGGLARTGVPVEDALALAGMFLALGGSGTAIARRKIRKAKRAA